VHCSDVCANSAKFVYVLWLLHRNTAFRGVSLQQFADFKTNKTNVTAYTSVVAKKINHVRRLSV